MRLRIAATLVAAALAATGQAQTVTIPAAANVEGVNQTRWRTDLQLKAEGGEPATVLIELLETGADNTAPAFVERTLGGDESLRLGNVLADDFGFIGTAALRLTPTTGGVLATSRTYNDAAAGTYGQTVPAVADDDGFGEGDEATLIMLSRSPDPSSGFRTNVGVVNLVGTTISVQIDLYDAGGTGLGGVSRNLAPFSHRQVNDVFAAAGATDVADGYAVVRTTTAGGRFVAYASVVDNGSGDAVFILGGRDTPSIPLEPRLVVFEALMRPG